MSVDKAPPPISFASIHKRAKEIVENDTMLAYAVGVELRKRLVGRPSNNIKHDMLSRLVYGVWNRLIELQDLRDTGDPKAAQEFLDLVTDSLIIGYNILTEKERTNG